MIVVFTVSWTFVIALLIIAAAIGYGVLTFAAQHIVPFQPCVAAEPVVHPENMAGQDDPGREKGRNDGKGDFAAADVCGHGAGCSEHRV
ncbi:MAG: hypothetical protein V8R95_00015 [Faecalibacterium sp.]